MRRYIDDMVREFAAADLIVCRAGATTSAELVAAGKAAVMVPFPQAADDHQRKNAEALAGGRRGPHDLAARVDGREDWHRKSARSSKRPEVITKMEEASRKLARGYGRQRRWI